jgi:ABC-type multidrug transport system fused ATPase/permease subunit
MFKHYFKAIKDYFRFNITDTSDIIKLSITAFIRTIAFLLLPAFASLVVDALSSAHPDAAYLYAVIFLLIGLIYSLFNKLNFRLHEKIATKAHARFQTIILDKVAELPEDYADTFSPAFITNVAFSAVTYLPDFPDQLVDLIASLFGLFASCIILFFADTMIGLATLIFLVISLIALLYNMRHRERYARRQLSHQDSATNLLAEVIDGRHEVQSLNLEKNLQKLLADNQKSRRKAYDSMRRYRNRVNIIIPAVLGLGRILIYALAIMLIFQNPLASVATFVLVIGYYIDLESNFASFQTIFSDFSNSVVYIRRVSELLSFKTRHTSNFGKLDNTHIVGRLEFDHVSLFYNRRPVFKNLSFTLKPHTITAIVGKSGSGKTQILKLILRLIQPSKGKIFLDDINIQRYTAEAYSTNVAMAGQTPFLFDLSIRENLNLINSDREKQEQACREVGLHDDILRLEKGYDTHLAADAANFSAGQKQLFSIARLLLTGSEVLLFDEVTANLDTKTSEHIFKILEKLKKKHTIIMVTHKSFLMKRADQIIFLDEKTSVRQSKTKPH